MRDRRGAYEIAPPRVRGARGLLRCSGVSGCGSKAAKRSRQTNRECVPLVRRARCPARYRRSARSLVGFRRVVVPIVVVASDGRSTPNPNTPSEGLMRYGIRDEKRPFQDVLDTRVRSSDRFFVQARRSDSCVVVRSSCPPRRRPPPRPPPHIVLILPRPRPRRHPWAWLWLPSRAIASSDHVVGERASQRLKRHGTWGASKWCLDIIYILLVTAEQSCMEDAIVFGEIGASFRTFSQDIQHLFLTGRSSSIGPFLSFSPQGFGRRKKRKINQQVNFSVQWHSGHRGPSRRSSEEDLVPRGPVMAAFG